MAIEHEAKNRGNGTNLSKCYSFLENIEKAKWIWIQLNRAKSALKRDIRDKKAVQYLATRLSFQIWVFQKTQKFVEINARGSLRLNASRYFLDVRH